MAGKRGGERGATGCSCLDRTVMFSRLRPGKPRDDPNREDGDDKQQKVPYKLQRPANTALRQQRLKAWQPLLTHSTVLPLLFGIGVLFAIMGGCLLYTSDAADE